MFSGGYFQVPAASFRGWYQKMESQNPFVLDLLKKNEKELLYKTDLPGPTIMEVENGCI